MDQIKIIILRSVYPKMDKILHQKILTYACNREKKKKYKPKIRGH